VPQRWRATREAESALRRGPSGTSQAVSSRPSGAFDRIAGASCPRHQQLSPRHPQIAQRKQHRQPRGVLGQAPVAHLGVAELLLDHTERVLNLGPLASFELFHLVQQPPSPGVKVQSAGWVKLRSALTTDDLLERAMHQPQLM